MVMAFPFETTRAAVTDAARLIAGFGAEAALQAALRAEQSRANDNVWAFCHWRSVQRLIPALACQAVTGTVH